MNKKIKNQILSIRDTAICNMLDINQVQVLANKMGYYELVFFIEEHTEEYVNFILTGKE